MRIMPTLAMGDRVRHVRHGEGTIERLVALNKVRVRFDASQSVLRTLSRSDIRPADESLAGRVAAAAANTASPVDPKTVQLKPVAANESACNQLDPADAWQALEALRLGVVPPKGARVYTVGRADEIESVRAMLAGERNCRVLWGDYGAGKTHMLDVTQQLALDQGFAVARLTLDPTDESLHRPSRIYSAIAKALTVPGGAGRGLDVVFDRLSDSPDHYSPSGRRFSRLLSPLLYALHREKTAEPGEEPLAVHMNALLDFAYGERVRTYDVREAARHCGWTGPAPLALPDFRTFGRMTLLLVGTLASWCRDAGFQGLVLLFDEVERVDALSGENRFRATEVLKAYAAATLDREDLEFDPEKLYRGGHAIYQQLPARFEEEQPLKLVMAQTLLPDAVASFRTITNSENYSVTLRPLDDNLVPELVRGVAQIYRAAHPDVEFSDRVLAFVIDHVEELRDAGHDAFRAMVRACVFDLDRLRYQMIQP